MISIFEYIDYRKYLEKWVEEEKQRNKAFSFRYFVQKSGINSPSFLKHVIEGERNLTRPVIEKFIKAISLSHKEARYFRHCVLFNQAKSADEKQEHYAVMRSLSTNVPEAVLSPAKYDFFNNWYTIVIRELVCLYDFKDNYELLAKALRPPIGPKKAEEAVTLLRDLKLIAKKRDGTYSQTDTLLTVDGPIVPSALRNFTAHMLSQCREALYNVNRKERHISGMTLGISEHMYHLIEAEIEAFKDRIKSLVTKDKDSDRVYQLNVGFIPSSKSVNKIKGLQRSHK